MSLVIQGQELPEILAKIPVPSGFVQSENKYLMPFQKYREEIYNDFTDKKLVGERFKDFALESREQRVYRFSEQSAEWQKTAFDFYMKLLDARLAEPGPVILNNTNEHNISLLKKGECTNVNFYASDFGGGSFVWFCFNDVLKRMSVTIGYADLLLLQEIYVKDKPIEVPGANELGFPLYPGAVFQPLLSGFIPGGEGLPKSNQMVFHSSDLTGKVVTFFEKALAAKAQLSDDKKIWWFQKKIPGQDWVYWPKVTICYQQEQVNAAPEGKTIIPATTEIRYFYSTAY